MKEIWKNISDYNGLYKVSNYGKVKSFHVDKKNGIALKQGLSGNGYFTINLCNKGQKSRTIHSLVAQEFIGNTPCGYEINHKDGNKKNNNLLNLEIITISENAKHAYKLGLKISAMLNVKGINNKCSKPVLQYTLDGVFIKKHYGLHDANRNTGIDYRNIYSACRGYIKQTGGFVWKYE